MLVQRGVESRMAEGLAAAALTAPPPAAAQATTRFVVPAPPLAAAQATTHVVVPEAPLPPSSSGDPAGLTAEEMARREAVRAAKAEKKAARNKIFSGVEAFLKAEQLALECGTTPPSATEAAAAWAVSYTHLTLPTKA